MRTLTPFCRQLVVATLWGGAVMAAGQAPASSNACPPVPDGQGHLVPNTNCTAATPTAPAADRFPYPGETAPTAPAPSAPAPNAPAPAVTGSADPKAPAGDRFPYPGETDAPTAARPGAGGAAGNGQSPLEDAGSSGASSSSDSSSSSSSSSHSGNSRDDADSGPGKNDPDANDPAAIPRSKRHKVPPVPRQSPSEREEEDVQVAGFYFNDGNYKGSYDRARDAVSLDADDPAAQLALGHAARKLGKLDEAEQAYKHCLELDPVPKVRKSAQNALREMTGGM